VGFWVVADLLPQDGWVSGRAALQELVHEAIRNVFTVRMINRDEFPRNPVVPEKEIEKP